MTGVVSGPSMASTFTELYTKGYVVSSICYLFQLVMLWLVVMASQLCDLNKLDHDKILPDIIIAFNTHLNTNNSDKSR